MIRGMAQSKHVMFSAETLTSSFGENNIMNTKPCMSSHNKRIIILIYTKDCSDIEGYKNQTNSVAQKMAASEVLSAQNLFEPWLIFIYQYMSSI